MMKRKRLEHLIKVLEKHNGDELQMDYWYRQDDDMPYGKEIKKVRCGYQACALGTAAMDRTFREEGLHLMSTGGPWADVRYRGRSSFGAAREFFDIAYLTARYLFDPCYYRQGDFTDGAAAYEVINRIQILLNLGDEALHEYVESYHSHLEPS
jgi:hypothetical protein